jgi:bifunctional DNase/RNase
MKRVKIHSLNMDAMTNSPVVLLRELEGEDDRVMPIWIGHAEAMAILLELQDVQPPRPLTHDLMKSMLDALEVEVERVDITRLEESTFFAVISLGREGRSMEIDARPSDSMALAVRTGAPIFVADDVWESASLLPQEAVDEEEEVERFREFLESIDPADFEEQ